eukprot:1784526-Prymnesium_polylepis.1
MCRCSYARPPVDSPLLAFDLVCHGDRVVDRRSHLSTHKVNSGDTQGGEERTGSSEARRGRASAMNALGRFVTVKRCLQEASPNHCPRPNRQMSYREASPLLDCRVGVRSRARA